jgi:cytochrome c biogenesis protein ResB
MNTDKTEMPPPQAGGKSTTIFGVLGSLRFALVVVLLIAAACVAGTLIPQGDQAERFLARHPAAQHRMDVFAAMGLTHVFFSWWFVTLLCVLGVSLLVCTGRRFQALKRAAGPKRLRVLGSLFTHVSLLLVLAGGVIRAVWGETGYIEFREGGTVTQFVGARGPAVLPFAVHLVKFELQLYDESLGRLMVAWPEKNLTNDFAAVVGASYDVTAPGTATDTCRVTIQRYVPDFCIDNATHEVQSRSEEPNNPAVQVEIVHAGQCGTNWVFARYPDFSGHAGGSDVLQLRYEAAAAERHVKAYRSTLQILANGRVVCEKTIAVNAPLSYGGYTLYQSGYNPKDLAWTSLQVVRDPGVWVVYIGFALMMAGLTMVFWVAPMSESGKHGKGEAS